MNLDQNGSSTRKLLPFDWNVPKIKNVIKVFGSWTLLEILQCDITSSVKGHLSVKVVVIGDAQCIVRACVNQISGKKPKYTMNTMITVNVMPVYMITCAYYVYWTRNSSPCFFKDSQCECFCKIVCTGSKYFACSKRTLCWYVNIIKAICLIPPKMH